MFITLFIFIYYLKTQIDKPIYLHFSSARNDVEKQNQNQIYSLILFF